MVTPAWVLFEPTVIAWEPAPDSVFGGTTTFTCITPEGEFGANSVVAANSVAGYSTSNERAAAQSPAQSGPAERRGV